MILIKSDEKNYGIKFPTSVNEVTNDVLKNYLSNVHLPKHYCIIAMYYKTKIFDFVAILKSSKANTVNVVPVLAKISDEDKELINAEVGRRVVIDRSSLERSVHLNVKCAISAQFARNYFVESPEYVKEIMTNKAKNNLAKQDIILLEFKIVPVNDISATIDNTVVNDMLIDYGNSN